MKFELNQLSKKETNFVFLGDFVSSFNNLFFFETISLLFAFVFANCIPNCT